MENIIANSQGIADLFKAIACMLPLVWAMFILVEWFTLKNYYMTFHIDHSFRFDSKIVFNPSYLLSLLFTLFVNATLYCMLQLKKGYVPIVMFAALLVFYIVSIVKRKNRSLELKKLVDASGKDKDGSSVVDRYRKTADEWFDADSTMWITGILAAILLGGVIVTCRPDSGQFLSIREPLSKAFRGIGGLRTAAYLLWFLISSMLMHVAFNKYANPNKPSHDLIKYFRVYIDDGKTYVILAPGYVDKNSILIAVRAVICRKKNGIIFGYLIQDDVITGKAPYSGKSFLIDVDKIGRVSPENYQSALLTEEELTKTFLGQGMVEYLDCNRKWVALKEPENAKDRKDKK